MPSYERLPSWFEKYRLELPESVARDLAYAAIEAAQLEGWSSHYWTRVCGLIGVSADPVKERALTIEGGHQRCGRFLCDNCRPIWSLEKFDHTLRVIRYLRRWDASCYRVRLSAPAAVRASASETLGEVLDALRKLQSGKGWNGFRERFGWYGWVTQVHEAACESGFRFSVEAMVWTRSAVRNPEAMLDDLAKRWASAFVLVGGDESRRPSRGRQLVWRVERTEGEALALHSKSGPNELGMLPESSGRFSPRPVSGSVESVALPDAWTVKRGVTGWWVWVPERRSEELKEVPDGWGWPVADVLPGGVPAEVAAWWDLECAWRAPKGARRGRKRVTWSSTFGPAPSDWTAPRAILRLADLGTEVEETVTGWPVPDGWVTERGVDRWLGLTTSKNGTPKEFHAGDVDLFRSAAAYPGWAAVATRSAANWESYWEAMGERPGVPEASGRLTGRAP